MSLSAICSSSRQHHKNDINQHDNHNNYHYYHNRFFLLLPLALNTIFLLLHIFASPVLSKRLRELGEPCGEEPPLMKCATGLECGPRNSRGIGKRRCKAKTFGDNGDDDNVVVVHQDVSDDNTTVTANTLMLSELCSQAKCPILFPDCPSDSVPVLSTVSINPNKCCPPALVQCRCDSQKCLIAPCPDGSERILRTQGINRPGQCCDQFDCRQLDVNCQNVQCPDDSASVLLDLYSPDGHTCPDDSYRPDPYIPAGSCCPIVPQCQCRLGICKPAHCFNNEKLIIQQHGQGKPGKCCDQYKCMATNGSNQNLLYFGTNRGCKHKGQVYAIGQRWHTVLCQECQCSAAGIALCQRMECPELAPGCQWIGLSPGECCSVCLGCRDEHGRTYAPGKHWEKDGCTNCTCGSDFRWQCQKFICQMNCENPRFIPDQCCPVCDQSSIVMEPVASCPFYVNCTLRCEFGLFRDEWTGCFECKCANGTSLIVTEQALNVSSCTPLTFENCPRLCAYGYLHDEQTGCPKCHCTHHPPMLNYSSFEKGTEQTIFIEVTRQHESNKTDLRKDDNNNDLLWLLSVVILAAFSLSICSISIMFMQSRRRKTKWRGEANESTIRKNASSRRVPIRRHLTFPDINADEMQPYATNLKQKNVVSGMSLLKFNEEA